MFCTYSWKRPRLITFIISKIVEKSSRETFRKISFYVVAHADDWQLFMHPNVHTDLSDPQCKVVFIITTAGDSGFGENFWTAREEGSKSSVRYLLAPFAVLSESSGQKKFNQHSIYYWSLNNTTSYFLRLPDGNLNGKGFPASNFQSLTRFKTGQNDAIASLDNSNNYLTWSDFVNTLESIISCESQGIINRWINYLNPDLTNNPGDHPDHVATGQALQNISIIATLHQCLFVGYSTGSVQDSLALTDLFWKAGMFAVYEKAVYDSCGYSTLKENTDLYARWLCNRSKLIILLPAY
ncbi:MAG: GlcNAc-PI de-N-acetylase [Ferruginibacter sp.]|nr:GlcNAc-PI de-N-acetylase [Ferruginibacter sp.]